MLSSHEMETDAVLTLVGDQNMLAPQKGSSETMGQSIVWFPPQKRVYFKY